MNDSFVGVYFDFYGTLIDSKYSLTHVWSRIAKKLGTEIEYGDPRIWQGVQEQWQFYEEKNYHGYEQTEEQKRELNQIVLDAMGVEAEPGEVVAEEFKNEFMTGKSFRLNPNCYTTLEQISSHDIKIGLLSHASANLCKPVLKKFNLLKYFDIFVLTSEIGKGYLKDEIKVYEIALEKMEVDDPKKIMHVGDDLYFDVKMAQKIGMTPVLFDPRKEHDVDDIITIHDLTEVLKYLINLSNHKLAFQ
jgi:HAD superfamily hydrolase (TIGR01549 family)